MDLRARLSSIRAILARRFSFGSVYSRLIVLLIFVLAPTVVFVLWSNSAYHAAVARRIRSDLVRQAHFVLIQETDLLDDTRRLLGSAADELRHRRGPLDRLSSHFRELIDQNPRFVNLGFATLDGEIRASAFPLHRPVSIADRSYFRDALENGKLSIGLYQTGRVTSLATLNLGLPVMDRDGRPLGVVFAAIDLSWLNSRSSQLAAELPSGSTMMEIDSRGVVLVRYPLPEGWVGRSIASSDLAFAMERHHDGMVRSGAIDSVNRLYAFTSLHSALFSGAIYIAVGIPLSVLAASESSVAYSTIRDTALLIVIAFVLFWTGAELLILRQLKALGRTSNLLRDGHFSARTHLPYRGEIGELARALDSMAESIEVYDARQRSSEEQRRESERRYRDFADSLPQIVCEVDLDGTITYANRQASAVLGHAGSEVPRGEANLLMMVAEGERARARGDIIRVAQGSIRESNEYTGVRADGTSYPAAIYTSPVLKEGRVVGLRVLVIDLTELKAAERALRESEERLRQAQKIEAIGQLAGGIAHDFNNLLTSIQGFVELARMEVQGGTIVAYLDQILEIGRRGALLTNQLLLFSRRSPMKLAPINLNRAVQGVTRILHPLLDAGIEIREHLDPALSPTNVDEGKIGQVLMNLLLNARDAMPQGGIIEISTRNLAVGARGPLPADGGAIALRVPAEARQSGSYVGIAVRDSGTGMARGVVEHLFEPFFTTKGRGSGTGLGLSVSYGIVKEHGGWLEVSTSEGVGSCFELFLPASLDPVPVLPPDPKPLLRGNGARVLVVDDEPDLRHFLEAALTASGFLVTGAATAPQATELFGDGAGAFDVVVSDLALAGTSGVDLVVELRRRRAELPCVLTSGFLDDRARLHSITGGHFQFLQKPFTIDDLLRAISSVMD